jgi:hypothetical protein
LSAGTIAATLIRRGGLVAGGLTGLGGRSARQRAPNVAVHAGEEESMRRLFAARGASAMGVGILVLLVSGGGYAIASGGGGGRISACVHKAGGGLFVAKKCGKHDTKLSWNEVGPRGAAGATGASGSAGSVGPTGPSGPQGPGATNIVYDATGVASPTPTAIGSIGPYSLTAICSGSGGTTAIELFMTGPSLRVDGVEVAGSTPMAESQTITTPTNAVIGLATSGTTTSTIDSADLFFIPATGTATQVLLTIDATGGANNTCHSSIAITPTS